MSLFDFISSHLSLDRFLMSYPRSGNTLLRFIIEYLTEKPTEGCWGNVKDVPICKWEYEKGVDNPLSHVNGIPLYYKSHGLLDFQDKKISNLIFIIRDYKECLVRNCLVEENFDDELFKREMRQYLELIKIYHSENCPKVHIYYEDLLNKPLEVIKYLHDFLGDKSNEDNFKRLCENYDELKDIVAFKGKAVTFEKVTSNFKLKFHFDKLSSNQQEKFNQYFGELINNGHYDMCRSYIERYMD